MDESSNLPRSWTTEGKPQKAKGIPLPYAQEVLLVAFAMIAAGAVVSDRKRKR
jgi:hypothetical protein